MQCVFLRATISLEQKNQNILVLPIHRMGLLCSSEFHLFRIELQFHLQRIPHVFFYLTGGYWNFSPV
jgi:hypothetical protein